MINSKLSLVILLVIAACLAVWRLRRRFVKDLTKYVLWAFSAANAYVGLTLLWDGREEPIKMFAGFLVWLFAAYTVKVGATLDDD